MDNNIYRPEIIDTYNQLISEFGEGCGETWEDTAVSEKICDTEKLMLPFRKRLS